MLLNISRSQNICHGTIRGLKSNEKIKVSLKLEELTDSASSGVAPPLASCVSAGLEIEDSGPLTRLRLELGSGWGHPNRISNL